MPGFGDELKSRLPQLALQILAGLQGPQALGALNQGMAGAQDRSQALARQAQMDEERQAQAEAVEARAQRDDTRADEAAQFQRTQALMQALSQHDVDPSALAQFYRVPQEAAAPIAEPIVSARKKRQIVAAAKEKYADALKSFGPEAMAGDSITIDGGELLGQVKPSQLMQLAEMPTATDAGGQRVPMNTGKITPPTPGSFEDFLLAPPERRAEIEGARRQYLQADDRPPDPVLGELRQMRLEQAKTGQGTAALAPATQRRVDMKTRAFDQQPVVKRIQMMAESTTFAEGLNPNTTNPADDQALIYAFAKAMDPESVVREGEYATVQKYAQSWAERFGFQAARIFSNTTFLTPEARSNMKSTIRARFAAAKPQYENLRRSYASQISRITNQGDGDSYLVDYAAGFPAGPQVPAGEGSAPAGAGATYDDYLRSRGQR